MPESIRQWNEIVVVSSPLRALAYLARESFDGLYITSGHLREALRLGRAFQDDRILDGMPDGLVLIDNEHTIVWANTRLRQWVGQDGVGQDGVGQDGVGQDRGEQGEAGQDRVIGESFYSVLGDPEILGPDFCPFRTAMATGQPSSSRLRVGENQFYHVHAAPIFEDSSVPQHLVVTIRDVTQDVLQQQKLAAIHKAGVELSDLTPDEIFSMEVDDRIELLKSNILRHTQDLLNFEVVSIRLLDEKTEQLVPLLSVGMDGDAAGGPLYANHEENGVVGFVAATGKSYLCEDTTQDPLYLEGCRGAKSSLTVPLILYDQVIGTFNVESPEPHAFDQSDLQFLEIFSRDVAAALNTLELMVAERANTAQQSVVAIHGAVALPVDEILNDAVNVMERYIGHEPEVVERLQRILRNTRDIKQVIHLVGQRMAPAEAVPASAQLDRHPKLRSTRVLVVDTDDRTRNDAHALLERYGCNVETARTGGEAIGMVRNTGSDAKYDVIIADIRLPDMNGYELMIRLKDLAAPIPLVLMTGFGYDPGHSIVKARQAGLHPKAVLYKPFRLDQLIETVETLIDVHVQVPQV